MFRKILQWFANGYIPTRNYWAPPEFKIGDRVKIKRNGRTAEVIDILVFRESTRHDYDVKTWIYHYELSSRSIQIRTEWFEANQLEHGVSKLFEEDV